MAFYTTSLSFDRSGKFMLGST